MASKPLVSGPLNPVQGNAQGMSVRRLKALPVFQSRLGRLVFLLNLIGLLILVSGSFLLNEQSQGLIDTKKDSLTAQATFMANFIAEVATQGDPEPRLEPISQMFLAHYMPKGVHGQIYNAQGTLLTDSFLLSENVDMRSLPPAVKADDKAASRELKVEKQRQTAVRELQTDIDTALKGDIAASVRHDERGSKLVSVAVPLRRVKAILGVLVLETGGVDEIIAAQRRALLPFAFVAFCVSLFSSVLINWLVSRPVQRLSYAADLVKLNKARAITLPDIEQRDDEIGALTRSLRSMTDTLWRRMDEIDRFAADVSHEIKNPLTSIRSALETLSLVKDEAAKERLMNVITQDVRRIDRLITDISNASRLDAELSREQTRPVELGGMLDDIISLYQPNSPEDVRVSLVRNGSVKQIYVNGLEGPLGQVFRNLIDNARSFSAVGGEVRVHIGVNLQDPDTPALITVEDDGPGIPEENLETVFQRFYTSRPKGTSFGKNSGLGLSISRQIIEAHNGRILARNRKDTDGRVSGASFSIHLPMAYHQ
jgi:two-component system, OmpR family, sensor histidine kinase ChvG